MASHTLLLTVVLVSLFCAIHATRTAPDSARTLQKYIFGHHSVHAYHEDSHEDGHGDAYVYYAPEPEVEVYPEVIVLPGLYGSYSGDDDDAVYYLGHTVFVEDGHIHTGDDDDDDDDDHGVVIDAGTLKGFHKDEVTRYTSASTAGARTGSTVSTLASTKGSSIRNKLTTVVSGK